MKEEISTMTRCCLFLLFLAQILVCTCARAQHNVQPDSLGLPGDNLNLYAVLRIFQESPTLEDFEKKLNAQESRINNLDLNGDGKIDYIRVIDHVTNNVHDIVLQIPVTGSESQDVAVIQVEKSAENPARVQIIGDEALYGKNYIIEPNYDPASEKVQGVTPNPGYIGTSSDTTLSLDGKTVVINNTTQAEVAQWPVIRYIYLPDYRPWFSPWHYAYYPPWWHPWRPFFWHFYWGYHYNDYFYYYGHYRRWHYYRNEPIRNQYYRSVRATSTMVLERKRQGAFQKTYARPEMRQVGVTRYNKMHRDGLARPMEGKPIGPGVMYPRTTRRGNDKTAVTRPGGIRPGQNATRPSTVNPGTGKSGKNSHAVGRMGKTRSPEGKGGREKEGRRR